MGSLAPHTRANREFFERGCAPSRHVWEDWIRRGVVKGKIIDGKPYVELNAFAVHNVMEAANDKTRPMTGRDLLS